MLVTSSPFETKAVLRSIAKRCICHITTEQDLNKVIISGIYEDNGKKWIQGVNIASVLINEDEDRLSNILIDVDKVTSIDFLEKSVYNIDTLTAEEAGAIMQRTDTIVKVAKDILGPQDHKYKDNDFTENKS